jgi:hypothetical protein
MAINPTEFELVNNGDFATLHIEHEAELQSFTRTLGNAHDLLHRAEKSYPILKTSRRALRRVAWVISRPLRVAILGESNSGKSSLANLILGNVTLPTLPVANTRLPTLLQYASTPYANALYTNGERFALSASGNASPEAIVRIEVGLPSETLRWIEILDFPGSANPLFPTDLLAVLRHGIDAAIWATVATQAWRETERTAWLGLPPRIRSRGILAVTHCDLIASGEDLKRLRARLEASAQPHFQGMCFVTSKPGHAVGSQEANGAAHLNSLIWHMAQRFSAERLEKAMLMTRHLAAQAFEQLGP